MKDIEAALKDLLDHYTQLVNCGDCGNWNPEAEPVVIAARECLALQVSQGAVGYEKLKEMACKAGARYELVGDSDYSTTGGLMFVEEGPFGKEESPALIKFSEMLQPLFLSPPIEGGTIRYLANGIRCKVSYREDLGHHIAGLPESIAGRWVAFVAAEDDCHLRGPADPCKEGCQYAKDIGMLDHHYAGTCMYSNHPDYATPPTQEEPKGEEAKRERKAATAYMMLRRQIYREPLINENRHALDLLDAWSMEVIDTEEASLKEEPLSPVGKE